MFLRLSVVIGKEKLNNETEDERVFISPGSLTL